MYIIYPIYVIYRIESYPIWSKWWFIAHSWCFHLNWTGLFHSYEFSLSYSCYLCFSFETNLKFIRNKSTSILNFHLLCVLHRVDSHMENLAIGNRKLCFWSVVGITQCHTNTWSHRYLYFYWCGMMVRRKRKNVLFMQRVIYFLFF